MKPVLPGQTWARRFLGVLLLVVFLCGGSGLQTELGTLLASMDGSHDPIAGMQTGGGVLVLAHPRDEAGMAHHHGWVARGLCAFTRSSMQRPDHRLVFAAPGAAEMFNRALNATGLLTTTATHTLFADAPDSRDDCMGARPCAGSPRVSDSIRRSRSTVLLL